MAVDEELDGNDYADAPADWIPPQFREDIDEPVADVQELGGMFRIIDGDTGEERLPSPGELEKVRRVLGVRDTRNGQVHMNISGVQFMSVDINPDFGE